jgi:hypothetical protein
MTSEAIRPTVRCRAGLFGRRPGPARGPLRTPLAAVRPPAAGAPVPYLPGQTGYHKRLRAAGHQFSLVICRLVELTRSGGHLAVDDRSWRGVHATHSSAVSGGVPGRGGPLVRSSGKPIREVAEDLGVSEQTQRNRARPGDLGDGRRDDGLTSNGSRSSVSCAAGCECWSRSEKSSRRPRLLRSGERSAPMIFRLIDQE